MLKSLFLIAYNILRIALNKLLYGQRFAVHWVQRFSPYCALKVYDNGRIVIGRNTELAAGCDFEAHGNGCLQIGGGTYFNRYCMISAHKSIKIGKRCMFGPGVKIFDNNHRFSSTEGVSSELRCGEITIGDNCWIASDAIILKGANIGDCCLIGAGCIISGDVPSSTVVKQKQDVEMIDIQRLAKQ